MESKDKYSFPETSVANPKRTADPQSIRDARLFPYYAGYSSSFASGVLESLKLDKNSLILDPWNGSGTTTNAANILGYRAIGFDLNPAMVIVAKANMLSAADAGSLPHLARSLVEQALSRRSSAVLDDALGIWFSPQSTLLIRTLELEINRTLVSFSRYEPLKTNKSLKTISSLASFFYLALFQTCRRLLQDFVPTNPTWIKSPTCSKNRKRPSSKSFSEAFVSEVEFLSAKIFSTQQTNIEEEEGRTSLLLGNSENIELPDSSVDAVITSPPYCTRIDYAKATAIELAILGFSLEEFNLLRRSLTGTPTVEKSMVASDKHWGKTCLDFLNRMERHPSKASKSYYLKNHVQYFHSLSRSVKEISRILSEKGKCVLVVQDSNYKELRNDVPKIVCEMAMNSGLKLLAKVDFSTGKSMGGRNIKSKKYVEKKISTESVLYLGHQ